MQEKQLEHVKLRKVSNNTRGLGAGLDNPGLEDDYGLETFIPNTRQHNVDIPEFQEEVYQVSKMEMEAKCQDNRKRWLNSIQHCAVWSVLIDTDQSWFTGAWLNYVRNWHGYQEGLTCPIIKWSLCSYRRISVRVSSNCLITRALDILTRNHGSQTWKDVQ